MQGYSTKYALTKGIQEVTVRPQLMGDGPYVYTKTRHRQQLKVGRDFFKTREEAEVDAGYRALRKIASLQKQIAKMQQLAVAVKWAED